MNDSLRKEVLAYMRNVVSSFVEHGEVIATALAEDAAFHFEHPEWLDDDTNEVWDLAVDVANEFDE